ncbi:hypothetical protein FTX61_06325 [Nitriliruptoraceae bacterium ZYF776]|nr:hypothetical protein [Profundirhabdus halotolerans]
MMAEITRYLLIYDHELERLVAAPREFQGDAEVVAALDAYDAAEDEYADQHPRFEVLLVGADSLATVKVTHGRFFRRAGGAFDALEAAI